MSTTAGMQFDADQRAAAELPRAVASAPYFDDSGSNVEGFRRLAMSRRKRTILKDRGSNLRGHRHVLRVPAACRDSETMLAEGPDLELEAKPGAPRKLDHAVKDALAR
jgi:hypothetical protein